MVGKLNIFPETVIVEPLYPPGFAINKGKLEKVKTVPALGTGDDVIPLLLLSAVVEGSDGDDDDPEGEAITLIEVAS